MIVLAMMGVMAAAQAEDPKIKGNPAQYFGRDAYPPEAVRKGEQGRVATALQVDAAGRVTACTIDVSSGSPTLDAVTCRIARERLAFTPAKDARGNVVAGRHRLPVTWVLDPSPARAVDSGPVGVVDNELRFDVDETGMVTDCRAILGGQPTSDPCPATFVGTNFGVIATLKGKPVPGTIVRRVSDTIQPRLPVAAP